MLSLYAAFNTKTGEMLFRTADRHTSAKFVAFLNDIVINQPRGDEIHVIVEDLWDRKNQAVKDLLEAHPKVQLYFIPTYSSWLDKIELSLGNIERDVYASVPDLRRMLIRYMRHYNQLPWSVKST
jgi:transposase